jgi:hypothetical protein
MSYKASDGNRTGSVASILLLDRLFHIGTDTFTSCYPFQTLGVWTSSWGAMGKGEKNPSNIDVGHKNDDERPGSITNSHKL